jgi:CRP/FNR family transcriptional regulator, dissimilatory nitrate respiration regulator
MNDAIPLRVLLKTAAKPAGINVQAFLGKLPMFSEMSQAEIDRIAAFTLPSRVAKGEAVFHAGDPCTGFHIVVYGQVKLGFHSPNGGEKVVEIIGPGQSFGEALMFLEKPYIVFAHALADTMLLHVARHCVFSEIERDPAFSRKMLSGLSRKLHGLVKDVEAYSLRSSAERLIGYLLREGESPSVVELSAGKSVVASRLNMTPEHFSRVLHELATAGLIEVDGRTVRILDLEGLRGFGC